MNGKARRVLIVGGGVSGMAAAQMLTDAGVGVDLADRRERLGGHAFDWSCMATDTCQNCGACLIAEMADNLSDSKIAIHLGKNISSITKSGDTFTAKLEDNAETLEADAVLLATGFKPFDPTEIPSLGYPDTKEVVTTADLNKIIKEERLGDYLPQDKPPRIAFIQCIGSRNREEGRDYCSQICCKTAVRDAQKLSHRLPDADITIFHIDLQVIGKQFRSLVGGLPENVHLLQGTPAEILTGREPGPLTIIREDPETAARVALDFDMIVLAIGMQPDGSVSFLAESLQAKQDRWGFFSGEGAELPEGVFVSGAAKGPTDILRAKEQGRIAASQILCAFGESELSETKPTVMVVGSGREAGRTAYLLGEAGYPAVVATDTEKPVNLPQNVEWIARAALYGIEGVCGNYKIKVITTEGKRQIKAGAIIAAYSASEIEPRGNEITKLGERYLPLSKLAAKMANGDGALPQRLTFWLDHATPEYKSTSRRSLKTALALAKQGKDIAILMEKMLVHGPDGQSLYDNARQAGVRFIRIDSGLSPEIEVNDIGLTLSFTDTTLPDLPLSLTCDLLIVPETLAPPDDAEEIAQLLRQRLDSEGYLQSPNVRHRPVGSPRKGLFFVGGGHTDLDDSELDIEIAAVQAALIELPSSSSDVSEAPVFIEENKCVQCLTCYRMCPHSAITLERGMQPVVNTEACFACGICVGTCPAAAIRHNQYPSDTLAGEIEPGETILFFCERSAALAKKEADKLGLADSSSLRMVSVPCAGRLDAIHLISPLLNGAGRIVVAGCHSGNCRSMMGTTLASRRAEESLNTTGLDTGSLRYFPIAANEPYRLHQLLSSLAKVESDGKEVGHE